MITTQELKQRVKIETIISRDFPLTGQDRRFIRSKQHDSLVVDRQKQIYFWNSQHESGDIFNWLMARNGWDFKQAKAEVARLAGVAESEVESRPVEHYTPKYEVTDEWPEQDWQDQLVRVMVECHRGLFEPGGAKAKGWLNGPERMLSDTTLERWWIGHNPSSRKLYGYWVYAGVVIPHFSERLNTIFGLKIRLSAQGRKDWERHHIDKNTGEVKPAPKYVGVSGNKVNLYGADTLEVGSYDGFGIASTGKFKEHTIVAEGEFDVMLLAQHADDLAGMVTLGGANYRLPTRWLPALAHSKQFYVALDNDQAGQGGAGYWLSLTGKRGSKIDLPQGVKDITDLAKSGMDLRRWAEGIVKGVKNV